MRRGVMEGHAFRLRPVTASDAAFIVGLRTDPRAHGRLHPVSGRVEDQVAWLRGREGRSSDWYWIVERSSDGRPEGTVGLYGVDSGSRRAEWGRWILRPGSLAAVDSALLVYRFAFDCLGLDEVRCRTVADNLAVLSFHDRSGLERVGLVEQAFRLGPARVDAVEHRLRRAGWPATREILEAAATAVARLLTRPPDRSPA